MSSRKEGKVPTEVIQSRLGADAKKEVHEEIESPWASAPPKFRLIPEINPKTEKPMKFYACDECGGAVINRRTHIEWHRKNNSF